MSDSGSSGGDVEKDRDENEIQEDNEEYEQNDDADAEGPNVEAVEISHGDIQRRAEEIPIETFDELYLGPTLAGEVTKSWDKFLNSVASREAAGEALYAALFDSLPSLQPLFKTPRAIMAVRLRECLVHIVANLENPGPLKVAVETLGFQHLQLEVTVPRVGVFRDAICDLLSLELGDAFTTQMREAWSILLNYIGGAFIYVRTQYAERFSILSSSWATANNKDVNIDMEADAEIMGSGEKKEDSALMQQEKAKEKAKGKDGHTSKKGKANADAAKEGDSSDEKPGELSIGQNTTVPRTFKDMFLFNAVVMGFGGNTWFSEVLESFDAIVTNVSSAYRLQEECDILSLRMSKHPGPFNLPQYKAVMLASLRSLVPKDWNANHEMAWCWLWENVERMLLANMGKPAKMEKALGKLLGSLTDEEFHKMRTAIFSNLFSRYPASQDVFKQSATRLHFIADRVLAMTLEIFKEPRKVAEDISALGLRHVGYGVPTDLFSPFVTVCVDVVRKVTDNEQAEEGFRWSLSLISRILVRVIGEGATIVMRAINANNGKQLKEAVACAPRSQRASWVLNVQVGTQSISPLLWAISNGSLEAAEAIIQDLLTIRADRDRYYYGADAMFERHRDIVKRICNDAPVLLPTLLDGLVWRHRLTENGQRRVNYYVKNLLVDGEGELAPFIEYITDLGNAKVTTHPVIILVLDSVWNKVAFRTFMINKSWFLFTLLIFIISQAMWPDITEPGIPSQVTNFIFKIFIYVVMMGHRMYTHLKQSWTDIRAGAFRWKGNIPVPEYLFQWQEVVSLLLCTFLFTMLLTEPILHCLYYHGFMADDDLLSENCHQAEGLGKVYHRLALVTMLLYFSLIIDLSVVSTNVSAYFLICGLVINELLLFIIGWLFVTLAFSCAVATLNSHIGGFHGVFHCIISLIEILFGLFPGHEMDEVQEDTILIIVIFVYGIASLIFLVNLLVAQLNCSYQAAYLDMLGYARLNRGRIVVEVMPMVPHWRWERFVEGMQLHKRIEFGEGDVGLAGGVQVLEPANLHPTTVDSIKRYGGSTSPASQWPADKEGNDNEDRLQRMEKMLENVMRKVTASGKRRKGGGGSSKFGSSLDDSRSSHSSGASLREDD